MKQRNWQAILLRSSVVLVGLLVVLASIALLYVFVQVLLRFGSVLALFIVGAILAYVLNPAVKWVTARVERRWLGTVVVYVGAAVAVALLGVALVQPLVTESSSLIRVLRNPTAGSMRSVTEIGNQSHAVGIELRAQRVRAEGRLAIPPQQVQQVRAAIVSIRDDLAALGKAPPHSSGSKGETSPQPQIQVPLSYLAPLQSSTAALTSDYQEAVHNPAAPSLPALTRSIADADRLTSEAKALHTTLSTTPILLLDAQIWADQHQVHVNVTQSAGQAVRQITSQASSILSNTAAILSQTATLLLDLVLILIISVYFVIDGERMVQQSVAQVPAAYHRQATFFVTSLDSVLGGYIRAQILLALLAGTLGGVGAALLGVPYPLVIGVSTFLLQLLPVVGPILVYIIPVSIALLFTSVRTALVLLAYYIVMEQVVTNVIGPRLNSKSVGIHPLEAMAAALLGYPIGGVLGSFLAVPTVGLVHVLVKEAYTSWHATHSSPGTAATNAASTQDGSSMSASEKAEAGRA